MNKEEFDKALFGLILSKKFHEIKSKQIKMMGEIIFENGFSETAKSSQEERLQRQVIFLSILNSEAPKELIKASLNEYNCAQEVLSKLKEGGDRLKAALNEYTCAQEILSKLNEGGDRFWEKVFHVLSDDRHGTQCLYSSQELKAFVEYINKANDKDGILYNARAAFVLFIPAYALICIKNEEYTEKVRKELCELTRYNTNNLGLLNADTIRLFAKAPDKAESIRNLLMEILHEYRIYCPNEASNQNEAAKKELRTLIEILHHSIINADKILKKCREANKGQFIGKDQFLDIVATFTADESLQPNDKPSKLGVFSRTILLEEQAQHAVSDKMAKLNL